MHNLWVGRGEQRVRDGALKTWCVPGTAVGQIAVFSGQLPCMEWRWGRSPVLGHTSGPWLLTSLVGLS